MKVTNLKPNSPLDHTFSRLSPFFLLAIFLLLSGCLADSVPSLQEDCVELPEIENGGRLSFFINLESAQVKHAKVTVSQVEVLANGQWLPVSDSPIELDTGKIKKGQTFLGSRVIPAGKYEKIRLTISSVHSLVKGEWLSLKIDTPAIEVLLTSPVEIAQQSSAVVSIAWDAHSVYELGVLKPLIFRASHSQTAYVVSNNAYVSCPDINNIYVVRTDKNWVQESFYVSGRPTYIAADGANKKLYVLAEDEAKIKIVDMVNLLVSESIKIPMARKPVFMTMMPDFTIAYIIDDIGNVIKMDVRSGLMLARSRVGQRPVYAAYLSNQEKLVVSSSLDNTLYFVDPDTLETIDTLSLEGSPDGLLEWENYLYIAEGLTNKVSLYDFNLRRVEKSIPVGHSPSRLIRRDDSIYLANKLDSTVSFMKGGLFFINKNIATAGSPAEMAVAEYNRVLYVANGGCAGNLAMIDLTSDRFIGKVDLGSKPFGLAVIQ